MVNVRLSGQCWQWKKAPLAEIRGCLMIMSHYSEWFCLLAVTLSNCMTDRCFICEMLQNSTSQVAQIFN